MVLCELEAKQASSQQLGLVMSELLHSASSLCTLGHTQDSNQQRMIRTLGKFHGCAALSHAGLTQESLWQICSEMLHLLCKAQLGGD